MRYALVGLLALAASPALAQPLPEGPVARLGSTKFRAAAGDIALSPDGKSAALRVGGGIEVMSLDTGAVTARLRDETKLKDPRWTSGPHYYTFAFAPGGKEVVTAMAKPEVWVWDAATGKPLRSIPGPERDPFTGERGKQTAVVLKIHNCQLGDFVLAETMGAGWQKLDPKTGKWTPVGFIGYDKVSDVSPDGRWVTDYTDAASIENYVGVTDTKTNKGVFGSASAGSYPFTSSPSPDGKLVACTTTEAGPQVWETATSKERKLKGIDTKVSHGAPRFTPDGKVLFVNMPESIYDEKTPPHFARWDVATGERLPDWKMPARIFVWAIDHANNRLIAVAGQIVHRIDLATGKFTPPPDGFLGNVRPAISPDGKLAAVGDAAGVVRTYAAPFTGEPRTLRAGGSAVDDLRFSPDGKTLFAAHADRTIGVWDLETGKETATLKAPAPPAPDLAWFRTLKLAVSPDGKTLVGEVEWNGLWAWDVATGKMLWEVRGDEKGKGITGCRPVFSPDGSVLYYGRDNAQVSKFDPRTGKELRRVQVPVTPKWNVTRLAVSPDGKKLAAHTYFNEGYLVVLDPATGSAAGARMFKLDSAVGGVAFSGDGSTVITTHVDGRVSGWRADDLSKEVFTRRGPAGYVSQLQLTADGKRAITDSPGATALVWELK